MKRTTQYAVCFLWIVALIAAQAAGQAVRGTPPFGSFGGGPFDTVNLGNLNVHFLIPVRHKAGRGTPFKYDLTYDSSVWYPTSVNGVNQWQPVGIGYWGWFGLAPIGQGGTLTYSTTITSGNCGQYGTNHWTQWAYNNFVYTDSAGTHPFNYNDAYIQADPVQNCPPTGPQPPTTPAVPAPDGSGLTLYATPNSNGISASVTTRTGTTFNGSGFNGSTDANGNQITLGANGVYTDTLGQTALTVTGAPPSNTTLVYATPSGGSAQYTVAYKPYTVQTNFGCSSVRDYGPTSNVYLVDYVALPDDAPGNPDRYTFSYESTPGASGNVTGRIASVTLPTGGSINYQYTGANNGINCSDGSAMGLNRTVNPGGQWTYTRSQIAGSHWQTTITDPSTSANQTQVDFQQTGMGNFYETQRVVDKGPIIGGTLLAETYTCYDGQGLSNPSACTGNPVGEPLSEITKFRLPNGGPLESETDTKIDTSSGLPTEVDAYAYASGGVGPLLQKTATTYEYPGNSVVVPSGTVVTDASGNVLSETTYAYDEYALQPTSGTPQHNAVSGARGNVTTVTTYTSSSGGLTKHFSYYDTGNVYQATDANTAVTTYTYGACGNSFLTQVSLPLGLSTSEAWDPNCTGGVVVSTTDANSQTTTISYGSDPFWRPITVTDPLKNITTNSYATNSTESVMNFGSSTSDTLTTVDGFGRKMLVQTRQGPGSGNFDTVQYSYDANGRLASVSAPCTASAGNGCSGAATTTSYDALNRPVLVTDAGGGTLSYTYSGNDVVQARGPAPAGEGLKEKQLEYDGLGRLTSVCELTQGTGYGNCAQTTNYNGYWTTYAYSSTSGENQVVVTQNAQSSSKQTRTYLYDLMGRLVQEGNPESGVTNYYYDSASGTTCTSSSPGDLIKKTDANGNWVCYIWDPLHRITDIGNSNQSASNPCKRFRYDNSAGYPGSMKPTVANTLGRLAEAATDACDGNNDSLLTDEWFSYSARGEPTDAYQSTPHSGKYYHPSVTYWANGALKTLWISSLPSISYGLDGEGRPLTVSASSGQNPVTGGSYNVFGEVTGISYGSGDSDALTFDPNTGRMTQYKYTVNGSSEIGNLGWNPNGSLGSLGITDPFNAGNTQSCTYMHDDLGRIDSAGCGSVWAQTFSYDAFGNVTKSGSVAWQPGYSQTTNRYQNGSTYDADGNLLNDTFHAYTWDVYGKMTAVDSTTLTYDAFGRMVEQNKSGTYYQIVYTPMGSKFGVFKGSTIQHLKVPLPGGAEAEYSSTGLTGYRHKDWLGSNRLETSPSHAIIGDNAYGPYGEVYARTGNAEISFTGQDSDTVWPQYDFLARQYTPNQGRWISPDPAGLAAVDPTNPQTWNRYAYVMNSPLRYLDPLGLDTQCTTDSSGYTTCTSTVMGCPSGMTFQSGGCVGGQCQGAQGTINVNGITICGPSAEYIYIQNQIQQAEQCANGGCQGGYSGGGGSGGGANNAAPQPPTKKPSWLHKYLSCVANTAAEDTLWGAIGGGVIGIGATALVTAGGAVAGSEIGPEGALAGAGVGFALSVPFILPAVTEGAITGAETGLIHGGIACL